MFHDFAYRLQESVPNKSASNEFVRKRALSFLYGIQKAIWITEIRLFTSLSHFPSILYGQSRRIIVSHYAVPTEWQRFSLKCCHSFLLSESQIKCTCFHWAITKRLGCRKARARGLCVEKCSTRLTWKSCSTMLASMRAARTRF